MTLGIMLHFVSYVKQQIVKFYDNFRESILLIQNMINIRIKFFSDFVSFTIFTSNTNKILN